MIAQCYNYLYQNRSILTATIYLYINLKTDERL